MPFGVTRVHAAAAAAWPGSVTSEAIIPAVIDEGPKVPQEEAEADG